MGKQKESFKDLSVNSIEKETKERVDKISEEHLSQLQNIVNGVNSLQFNIGKIEAQKHKLLHNLSITQDKVSLMQDTLKKSYGSFDVNIEDGTINWPKDEK